MQMFNTSSGGVETFEPMALPIKMYVCGLTPKNEPHLGHARLFVVNDMVRRYLEYRSFPVRYIQNFTDIDDKIIAAGLREGIPPSQAARRYTESYFRDMDKLNVRRAEYRQDPRAAWGGWQERSVGRAIAVTSDYGRHP